MQKLLERVAARQRESAELLQESGYDAGAERAQRAASRIDLTLDQPDAVHRMHKLIAGFKTDESLLDRALEGAIALSGADFGNIQLRDAATDTLKLIASAGFGREFIDHFATVRDTTSACGRASAEGVQTVIVDVETDPGFAPHRRIAAKAGFRSVQSTPLLDRKGRVVGVISTHFRRSHRPSDRDLQIIAWYGERLGAAMAAPPVPDTLQETTATRHERSAERHEAVSSLLRSLNAIDSLPSDTARMQRRAAHEHGRAERANDRADARRNGASSAEPDAG